MKIYRKKSSLFNKRYRYQKKKKKKCWLSVVSVWRPRFQLEEIALEQLNGSARALPRQQQGRGFISCGSACICPHRPSPGWPPYWSSPHRSCCDTPEENTTLMIRTDWNELRPASLSMAHVTFSTALRTISLYSSLVISFFW